MDLVLISANFGKTGQNIADVNGDGVVNIVDLVKVAGAAFGEPVASGVYFYTLSAGDFSATRKMGQPHLQHIHTHWRYSLQQEQGLIEVLLVQWFHR